MTTCEWIYIQTFLTDLALDHADKPEEREFLRRRLQELQGRVGFERRLLASKVGEQPLGDTSTCW